MHQQDKKGFTIIELMLAMSVVALLLLAIATMTMQMITIMTKGNTFRELNAAGRTINDDFTREFNSIYGLGEWTGRVVNDPTADAYYVRNGDSGAFCEKVLIYGIFTIIEEGILPTVFTFRMVILLGLLG